MKLYPKQVVLIKDVLPAPPGPNRSTFILFHRHSFIVLFEEIIEFILFNKIVYIFYKLMII